MMADYPPGRPREEGDDYSERVQRSPRSVADRRRELEAELARLDAEDRAGVPAPAPVAPAPAPGYAKADDPAFTHYVHLADGRVIKHFMAEPLGSHYVEAEDGNDIPVQTQIIGVYPR